MNTFTRAYFYIKKNYMNGSVRLKRKIINIWYTQFIWRTFDCHLWPHTRQTKRTDQASGGVPVLYHMLWASTRFGLETHSSC